jgi:hypothetical protein
LHLQTLTLAWETEREEMKKLQAIKAEIDRVNLEVQNAEREYDLNRAAELKYGVLVSLQKQLKAAEEALSTQVRRAGSCTRNLKFLKRSARGSTRSPRNSVGQTCAGNLGSGRQAVDDTGRLSCHANVVLEHNPSSNGPV